jgi:RimJ/RimL family protein N-acetyltransferase
LGRPLSKNVRLADHVVEHDVGMAERVVLTGDVVTLRPMVVDDVDALVAAANEERTTYAFTHVPDGAAAMREYVEAVLEDERVGWALPFVTTLGAGGRVVGSTRFLDLDDWDARRVGGPPSGAGGTPRTAEIGATWLAASVQRTAVNTEAKLLMLRHAFDTWEAERITFKTDARNARSRAAIERLGAHFEGVRRAHVLASDGGIRDSAYYSIVRVEWPAVRSTLEARLAR